MSSWKLATAVAAIVAVMVGSVVVLAPRRDDIATPRDTAVPSNPAVASSPSPAASAGVSSASPTCNLNTTGCAGALSAGLHNTVQFVIPFRFRVPDGWTNTADINRTYQLESTTGPGARSAIEVLGMVAIADQRQGRCDAVAKAGVGQSVDDVIAYVRGHRGLVSTAPTPVTLDGFAGRQIEFSLNPTWGEWCPGFNPGDPKVLLLTDTGNPPQRTLSYGSDVRIRWTVLDVNGQTVIVEEAGPVDPAAFAADVAYSHTVVQSIDFLPGS